MLETTVQAILDGHHMLQVGRVVVVILHALRHIIKLGAQLPRLYLQAEYIYTNSQWYENGVIEKRKLKHT